MRLLEPMQAVAAHRVSSDRLGSNPYEAPGCQGIDFTYVNLF